MSRPRRRRGDRAGGERPAGPVHAGEFADLIEQFRRADREPDPFGIDLAGCREEGRVAAGVCEAFGAVHAHLGWDRLFGARRMSARRIAGELALARIAQPLSRRATVRELSLNLDNVHRSMDLIDDARLHILHLNAAHFVLRAKKNTKLGRLYSNRIE